MFSFNSPIKVLIGKKHVVIEFQDGQTLKFSDYMEYFRFKQSCDLPMQVWLSKIEWVC